MMEEKRLFALGDFHLSLYKDKPMSIFGDMWIDHHKKIEENWNNMISPQDTVLIAGDISWAMTMEEAAADLDFISGLAGEKILIKGNHDYWWSSVSRLNSMYEDMLFLQNDCCVWEDYAICGSRGWILPTDPKFAPDDMRAYKRELKRYELSLERAVKTGKENIIFMSHYPPLYKAAMETEFTDILEKYKVQRVIYGHLHGTDSFLSAVEGDIRGIEYSLVSADYLNFAPKRIL